MVEIHGLPTQLCIYWYLLINTMADLLKILRNSTTTKAASHFYSVTGDTVAKNIPRRVNPYQTVK